MQKNKFKVVGDSKNTFMDIEFDMDNKDYNVGDTVSVLGGTFTVQQAGNILVLKEKDKQGIDVWMLSIMDITEPEVTEEDEQKLKVGDTIDIYFDKKEISVRVKCTYEELFYFLQNEWKAISQLPVADKALPFEYTNRLKQFVFKNGWNFDKQYGFMYVNDGSYSRISVDGRSI